MTDQKNPLYRSFELRSEFPDIARLAICIELFDEMDKAEAVRTLRYLKDRYVANRAKAAGETK